MKTRCLRDGRQSSLCIRLEPVSAIRIEAQSRGASGCRTFALNSGRHHRIEERIRDIASRRKRPQAPAARGRLFDDRAQTRLQDDQGAEMTEIQPSASQALMRDMGLNEA